MVPSYQTTPALVLTLHCILCPVTHQVGHMEHMGMDGGASCVAMT